MGCGMSKATVVPQQTIQAWSSTDEVRRSPQTERKRSPKRRKGNSGSVKIHSRKNSNTSREDVNGETSLGSNIIRVRETKSASDSMGSSHYSSRDSITSSRSNSASSTITKSSAKSDDSGLGQEYSHIITEKSKMEVKEAAQLPSDITTPDLIIRGQRLKTASPLSHRKRLPPIRSKSGVDNSTDASAISPPGAQQKHVSFSESLINELPESPSIIKRPCSRSGVAFDIMVGETSSNTTPRRRPARLQRLEKRQEPITLRDLVEKQREAKQRREEQEQMMIERIRAREEKDRQVAEALAKFAAMQMEMKAEVENKMKSTLENREAHFKALQEKLKEKSDKVDEVKKAKKTRKLAPLKPLRDVSVRQSVEDIPVNLGAN